LHWIHPQPAACPKTGFTSFDAQALASKAHHHQGPQSCPASGESRPQKQPVMTYSEVVALLEEVAQAAGAAGFYQGPKQAKGVAYDEPFPQAHLYLMPDVVKPNGITYSVGMGFFGKDEHENGGPESVAIQNQMDLLTQAFYRLLLEQEDIELGAAEAEGKAGGG
jgi:hypothetical protein